MHLIYIHSMDWTWWKYKWRVIRICTVRYRTSVIYCWHSLAYNGNATCKLYATVSHGNRNNIYQMISVYRTVLNSSSSLLTKEKQRHVFRLTLDIITTLHTIARVTKRIRHTKTEAETTNSMSLSCFIICILNNNYFRTDQ